ncbi:UBX domain-containing protein 7 [Malaya genurostris]|uniref:UBX domain-containing protein 7 n=1 Tax=Malaya genurostris TaxID=325434 RepID=UPI0026F3F23D|nr:UBX domain-containing protein 7 [Malaya genurostris]
MSAEENVKSLSEITGLKTEQASSLLSAYNGNVEGAINAFFENPEGILNPEPPVVVEDDEDNVRAPIPRKTEILLPPSETSRGRLKRRGATITEVPFRNFELEGKLQEQMLMQGQGPSSKKITRLEALFMPPFEILFSGNFDMAQRHGKSVDKWILVNLQDDLNFTCQILNRDLWSDAKLKDFLRIHLIFWQTSNKTTDGAKFKTFYKVNSEPYIGMIDPRTGEEVQQFSTCDIEPSKFLSTLKNFLIDNKSPNGKEVSFVDSSLMRPSTSQQGNANGSKPSTSGKPIWVPDDEEEEFQEITDSESDMEPDTPTSKNATKQASVPTETPSSPVLSSDEEASLPAAEKTRIMLKMPGDITERLFFRSSRTVDHTKAKLMSKFTARFADHKGKSVRFFCPAIKTDLASLDGSRTLLELKIHPNAVIHVTVDD